MEPLADAVGLGRLYFGLRVINIVDRQEELEVVFVNTATIFGASVGHDPQYRQAMFFMERQHAVVEQISRSDWRLRRVELGVRDLAIGIDISLLVDASDALQCADIESIL